MSLRKQLAGLALAALATGAVTVARAQNISSSPELDQLLDDAGRVWTFTASDFAGSQSANGFRWTSVATKDVARSTDPQLTFIGLRVWEALARFESGTLKELSLSLYNRGDAGTMPEDKFLQLLASIDKSVTAWSGMRGSGFKSEERTTSITVMRKAWVKGTAPRGHGLEFHRKKPRTRGSRQSSRSMRGWRSRGLIPPTTRAT